mmetsp:Transcript_67359/g.179835  ORF Transcript_67359/g.179835 Transcript_67359/m.179835 type:complete len:227 (-) Transcript_67359:9-689(-)
MPQQEWPGSGGAATAVYTAPAHDGGLPQGRRDRRGPAHHRLGRALPQLPSQEERLAGAARRPGRQRLPGALRSLQLPGQRQGGAALRAVADLRRGVAVRELPRACLQEPVRRGQLRPGVAGGGGVQRPHRRRGVPRGRAGGGDLGGEARDRLRHLPPGVPQHLRACPGALHGGRLQRLHRRHPPIPGLSARPAAAFPPLPRAAPSSCDAATTLPRPSPSRLSARSS